MISVHRIDKNGEIPREEETQNDTQAINSDFQPLDKLAFRRYLIRWIASDHISFRQIESPCFRDLIAYCCYNQEIIPQTGKTIRNWLLEDYRQVRIELQNTLNKSDGQIHISFDGWTSPNSIAMIGVIAYWINDAQQLQIALLGLRELAGKYSGDNMASEILAIINDFEIGHRIGHFIADNLGSNNSCIEKITNYLGNRFKTSDRRLRCFGHIVNLVVKALLFGKDVEAFEKETLYAAQIEDNIKELRAWRKKGPVGKIHNIVTYIRRSPQRIQVSKQAINL